MSKVCSSCHVEKALDCFCLCKKFKDGRNYTCRDCVSLYKKQYKQDPQNRQKEYTRKKEWVAQNLERTKEYKHQHYESNKDLYKTRSNNYYYNNKPHVLEVHKKYYEKNRDAILERCKQYKLENWQKIAQRHAERKRIMRLEKPPKTKSYVEEYCRKVFERLFGKRFPSTRPRWLINPVTGHPLELDGFCEDEMVAFEYNGRQHLEFIEMFHEDEEAFLYQVYKDNHKAITCVQNEVVLIVITCELTTKRAVDEFICARLAECSYPSDIEQLADIPFPTKHGFVL